MFRNSSLQNFITFKNHSLLKVRRGGASLIGLRFYTYFHQRKPCNSPSFTGNLKGSLLMLPVSARYYFTSSSRDIKELLRDANANPDDADMQLSLLQELEKRGNLADHLTIIERCESKTYHLQQEATKIYLSTLLKMDIPLLKRLEKIQNRYEGVGGVPVTDGAVPVIIQTKGFWKYLPLLYPFLWVGVFLAAIKIFGSGDGHGLSSLFEIPSHHDRVDAVTTRFSDVKGCDEAKAELVEVVDYLKNPAKFIEIGAQLPKGILLVGDPGTGKTLLARAIAGEAGVPFFYSSGSSFDEIFVGVGSNRVRSLFADAKKNSPCIIFIDEIDAVGSRRNRFSSGSDGTLQQLLTELDGFEKNEGVIIIAATNMPDSLDPALVRPGRFDKQVVVPVPDVKGRKEILDLYLSKIKLDANVDSTRLARATPGFTGADLNQLVNLAAIKAVVQGKSVVSLNIIEETRDDIWMGRMRTSALVDEKTRSMTAYHEGGHALVSILTEGSDPVHKATIIQRGHALGMVTHLPEGDQLSLSRKQMMAKLAVAMAGRAAEEIVYGEADVTSGASSDFQQATKLAYNMVSKWGMSDKIGYVYHNITKDNKPSQETMMAIDTEVKQLLERQYIYAKDILKNHRNELDLLAKSLLERETLTGEEIKIILGMEIANDLDTITSMKRGGRRIPVITPSVN